MTKAEQAVKLQAREKALAARAALLAERERQGFRVNKRTAVRVPGGRRDAQGNVTHDELGNLVRDQRGRNVSIRGGFLVNQDGQYVDLEGRPTLNPVKGNI